MLVRALAKFTELHLLLEISPEEWKSCIFDVSRISLPSGIVSARPIIQKSFLSEIQKYYEECASFNLVVHNCRKSMHPSSWIVSHKLVKFIKSLEPNIMHCNDVSLRLAWAMPELKNIPIVLSIHDPEAHSGEFNWRKNLSRWLSFRNTKCIILHSRGLKYDFARKYKLPEKKIKFAPLGVYNIYREWIEKTIPEHDRTVLFFGRISPYKGLDVLYKAAPIIAEKVQNVRFIVAGRLIPGYRAPLPPVLPNNGQIEIIAEYINNSKLARLFQETTIVVCPYIDATQSGVVLTAYAFGKPVVATNSGGLPEYVKNNQTGLLIPPGDINALSNAIIKILNDKDLQQRLKCGVKQFKEKELEWDWIGKKTVDIYKKILQLKYE